MQSRFIPNSNALNFPYSSKNFPPPLEATKSILPLYEEEFFRQGNKSFRIAISKIGEEQYVGISQWFYQMSNQQWMPTTKQVQMTRFGWQSFLNLLPSIENELVKIDEADATEMTNNPGKILFKFASYLFYLFYLVISEFSFFLLFYKDNLNFVLKSRVIYLSVFNCKIFRRVDCSRKESFSPSQCREVASSKPNKRSKERRY